VLQNVDDVMGNGFPQELDGRVEIVGVGGGEDWLFAAAN